MTKPPIDEGYLLAYWDDAVSSEIRHQIETNPELLARARQLRAADKDLARAFALRAGCPSTAELGDYQHDLLDEDESNRIARHADSCPQCKHELAQMAEFMDRFRVDVDPSLADRVKVFVADLISGPPAPSTGPAWAMPAPAGIRGTSDERSWVYQAGDYQIAISAEDDPETPGRMMLIGLVVGPDIEDWRAELSASNNDRTPLRVALVDEIGNFELLGLPHGNYSLRLVGVSFLLEARGIDL